MLVLAEGGWSPPLAAALGHGTLALVILAGALLREPHGGHAHLLGPGDLLEPWTEPAAAWRACTPVRAAVIGEAFLRAVAAWPQAAAHMLRRVGAGADGVRMHRTGSASAEDRLAELLWRLAARWGTVEDGGIRLQLALAPAELAGLIAASSHEADQGLRALERTGESSQCADGTWLLRQSSTPPVAPLAAARDDVRERLAGAFARARATQAVSAELVEEAADLLRRGAEWRRR